MTVFVALLRAVNVGGTGMLPMKDLAALCSKVGLENVRTYIQTGNVVFTSRLSRTRVRESLEEALAARMGKKVDVILRDAAELGQVLKANPFPDAHPSRVAVAFCAEPVQKTIFESVIIPANEQIVVGHQEFYVHYPDGMGQSKLKFPKVVATVRNINTVTKLVAMADAAAPPPRPGKTR